MGGYWRVKFTSWTPGKEELIQENTTDFEGSLLPVQGITPLPVTLSFGPAVISGKPWNSCWSHTTNCLVKGGVMNQSRSELNPWQQFSIRDYVLFLFPNGIINAISFPMYRWELWGKRWDKAIASRLGSRLEWKVIRDVADNWPTEKWWCHQFSRLGLAALDSVPWIQQKTVETNLRLLYSNKKFFCLVSFSQNPGTKLFFLPLFSLYLNTNLCSKWCCTISLQQALPGAQGSLHPGPDCLISW